MSSPRPAFGFNLLIICKHNIDDVSQVMPIEYGRLQRRETTFNFSRNKTYYKFPKSRRSLVVREESTPT